MQEQQQRVEGTVVNANERGFQFAGAEAWLNWSKYAVEPRTLPAPGERIVAMLDNAGYVRSVLRAEGTKVVAPSTVSPQPQAARNPQLDRDFRLKCLALAVETLRSYGTDMQDVGVALRRADKIARWAEGEME